MVNRWHINNHDLKIGDFVTVSSVRSSRLDLKNGIGWIAKDVIVEVSKVNDLTFCFMFNGEQHFELKNDVKISNKRPNMFGELDKVKYANESFEYHLKATYSI